MTAAVMIGENTAVAVIMLIVGGLFTLLAVICFILLVRVSPR